MADTDTSEDLKKKQPDALPITMPALATPLRMNIPTGQAPNTLPVLTRHQADLPSAQRSAISRESYAEGMPRLTAAPFSPEYYQQREAINAYQKANPWGSAMSTHPGIMGRIGHVASEIGQAAGNALTPGIMERIPGSELNRAAQTAVNEGGFEKAQNAEDKLAIAANREETAKELADERAREQEELQSVKGTQAENLQTKKGEQEENLQETKGQQASAIQTQKGTQAAGIETSKEQSQKDIEKSREANQQAISAAHNAILREIANIRATAATDPNKLAPQILKQAQTAVTILPQVDNLEAETRKMASELGPLAGRWNDFMTGKVGAPNPEFAHYMDEMVYMQSAVTLAHSQGRVSNLVYDEFKKMFDVGKQSPENMIAALEATKDWMGRYAGLLKPQSAIETNNPNLKQASGDYKVGDLLTQNGRTFRVTKIDKNGKVLAADPAPNH